MDPISRSAHFIPFEAVTTYAIDGVWPSERTEIHDRLGLTPRNFFQHLYVARSDFEDRIRQNIKTGPYLVQVRGRRGCGKTSTVSAILDELSPTIANLLFSFDFRTSSELHGGDLETETGIHHWIEAEVSTAIFKYIQDNTIDPFIPLLLFFDEAHKLHRLAPAAEAIRFALYREFTTRVDTRDSKTLTSWLAGRLSEQHELVLSKLDDFLTSLRSQDLLYALVNHLEIAKHSKAILFFDNIDSIQSHKIRDNMRLFLRKYQVQVSDSTKIIVCYRPGPDAHIHVSDYKSYSYHPIDMDSIDWIDERRFEEEVSNTISAKKYCNERDKDRIRQRLHEDARIDFDMSIFEKRVTYLDQCIESGRAAGLEHGTLANLKSWFAAVLRNPHLNNDACALANGDRREMLSQIANFVEYMVSSIGYHLGELGQRAMDREFLFESYFLGWIVDYHTLFDIDSYNIIDKTDGWRRQRLTASEALEQHFILAAIHNLSGLIPHKYSTTRVPLGELKETCKSISIDEHRVQDVITKLIREHSQHRGLLETTYYHRIQAGNKLDDDHELSLNERARQLLEFVSLKFHYGIALMRHQGIEIQGKKFDYDNKILLSRAAIAADLNMLCLVGKMDLLGLAAALDSIREVVPGDDPFWHYRRWFCIRGRADNAFRSGDKVLLTENLFHSHIKFLEYHYGREGRYEGVVTAKIITLFREIGMQVKKTADQVVVDSSVEIPDFWKDAHSSAFSEEGEAVCAES